MSEEYSLPGIRTQDINILPDERGFFSEILRNDWSAFIDEWVAQANLSFSYPGIVRAWHRHMRGQVDYFLVIRGSIKICAYEEQSKKLVEVVTGQDKLRLVRIPGHYWHGFKSVSSEPAFTVYFCNRLYDYANPDEERRPWNDPLIVPAYINGGKNDSRIDKPWDWFYPAFK
jgi:dTDP-4-dehydrorhamnose 3,5-epimerase